MPDGEAARPRLFTIPPTAPFLASLARAVLSGDLPMLGGEPPDPLSLPRWTILLPTRRAARALREAFLAEAGREALLLPRIRPIGDPDEDIALFWSLAESGLSGEPANVGPAIGELERRLVLMRLVLAWGRTMRAAAERDASELGSALPIPPPTPAQASALAADLARLMDLAESEEVDLARVGDLVPESFAGHWKLTLDFLRILTEHWPKHLSENGLLSPIGRRNALMALEAKRLAEGTSAGPVIAAGSTGTVPATARLLAVVSKLPNGAVVLPGLDLDLDEESWASILAGHPEHPQFGMADLLRKLGATRDEVSLLPGTQPAAAHKARLRLISEALRPAERTEHWQQFLAAEAAPAQLAESKQALAGVSLIETPSPQDEAEVIALILRQAVEQPQRTAALVTPDRALARRVAARLRSWELAIDDSAGTPLARTVPAAFLDLVLGAIESDFAPDALMALLKHPLCRLRRPSATIREEARALERAAFRCVYVGEGLEGVVAALSAEDPERRRSRANAEQRRAALKLVEDIGGAFAPLTAVWRSPETQTIEQIATAHIEVAEALARDESGSTSALWRGEAGEALSLLLAELMTARADGIAMSAADYAGFYRGLLAGEVVRPRAPAHPRIFIWGPLEARLQHPDILILGSLNEGTWPRAEEAGPWLSRPMRTALGLSPPERRTGLAAHDFAQSLGASSVYLTRATKVDGVPTVPSRWVQRLTALLEGSGLRSLIEPEEPWLAWARSRDWVSTFAPARRPEPKPPVAARPRRLSVTRIERWIANPYEIFAREILGLEPFDPLGKQPDAADRGSLMHRALRDFALAHPSELPPDIQQELLKIAGRLFASLSGSTRISAFWRAQLESFARWFASSEKLRRAGVREIKPEVTGELELEVGGGFRLTARADRIDLGEDGTAVIYDYKTGKPPSTKHVDELFAPQLPLEAAMLRKGAFAGISACPVTDLRYIHVSGRQQGGSEQPATQQEVEGLAARALEALAMLVERFDRVDTAYEVKRRSAPAFRNAYRYDNYAHLARVKEWAVIAEEDEA